jgi:hypothetical protein
MIELYLALCRALCESSVDVKHIDRWNQNVEFIDQDSPWPRPAVFVEFGTITWDPYKGPVFGQVGKGTVSLHLITDWRGSAADGSKTQGKALEDLMFAEAIEKVVTGLKGRSFRNIRLVESHPNNNHEDIIETVDVYAVTFERTLAEEDL